MITRNLIRAAAASLLATTACAATAAVSTLTFEGLKDLEVISDFYNGGTGSMGSSGTNFGVSFGPNALAVIDSDAGGSGNIANEPTPSTAMFFLQGSAILNYSAGFTTGFSFWYTTVEQVGAVNVYDGLDATGSLIGTINLQALGSGTNCGDPTGQFCRWEIGSLPFSGTAKSIDFGGAQNGVAYDNITFGSTDPNRVPEPGSLALVGLALAGLAGLRRRRA